MSWQRTEGISSVADSLRSLERRRRHDLFDISDVSSLTVTCEAKRERVFSEAGGPIESPLSGWCECGGSHAIVLPLKGLRLEYLRRTRDDADRR